MSRSTFGARIDPRVGGSGLAHTRDRLRKWLEAAGVREPELHQILIAAGEACSNAIEHSGAQSSEDDPAGWIRVTCDERAIRIVVADRGRWKEPDPTEALSGRRGRGRLMMAGLVDYVDIHTGPTGTTVELVKEFDRMERHDGADAGESSDSPVGDGSAGGTALDSDAAYAREQLRIERSSASEVVLAGEIDMSNVATLRAELERAAAEAPSLLIDLCEVTYLDSAGVSALFDQAHHDLRLRVTADSAVATILKICGLVHVARVDFVPAAVAATTGS